MVTSRFRHKSRGRRQQPSPCVIEMSRQPSAINPDKRALGLVLDARTTSISACTTTHTTCHTRLAHTHAGHVTALASGR